MKENKSCHGLICLFTHHNPAQKVKRIDMHYSDKKIILTSEVQGLTYIQKEMRTDENRMVNLR